jgi:NAD(P)-dependent dehydrogenase (short-subunit alcohol dehydrogenase family)
MRIRISDQNFGDAAKAAVVEMTEVLAIEWAEQAVQVKAIGPRRTAYRARRQGDPRRL